MTGRPDAGPEAAGEPDTRTPPGTAPTGATDTTRRLCIDTDATPAQLRHAAQRLRDQAGVARTLAAGGRVIGEPAWESEEHARNAAAYGKAAAALEALGGTTTERAL